MTQGNFTTEHIREVGKDHYGEGRRAIRAVACDILPEKPRILELYGSGGHMTTFYGGLCKEPTIVGVDIAPGTDYQMDNRVFVKSTLSSLEPFDLLDFDAYGSPNQLIFSAFDSCQGSFAKQFIVVTTDGLGLAMKRNPNLDWMKFFLITDPPSQIPDLRRPWDHHIYLTEHFFQTLGRMFSWKVTCLKAIQAKGKNFVLAAYLFEKGL